MLDQVFYRKLTEAVSNAIMKAIDGDEMFDTDETELNPMEDDVEDSSVYMNHSKFYAKLVDMGMQCRSQGIEVTFIDNDGKEEHGVDRASDARFVRFSTKLLRDETTGIDNSIVISTRWKEHFDRINRLESPSEYGGQIWQVNWESLTQGIKHKEDAENDFNGYSNTLSLKDIVTKQGKDYKTYIPAVAQSYDATEKLNGREIHGYLPAMGQLRFMCDNIDLINDILELLHVETIAI